MAILFYFWDRCLGRRMKNNKKQIWMTQSDSYCGRKRGMNSNLTKMPDVTTRHERIFIGLCETSRLDGEEV